MTARQQFLAARSGDTEELAAIATHIVQSAAERGVDINAEAVLALGLAFTALLKDRAGDDEESHRLAHDLVDEFWVCSAVGDKPTYMGKMQ